MKRLLLAAATLALPLLILPGCTSGRSEAHGESRLSGRAGVALSSAQLAPPLARRPGGDQPPPP